MKPTIPACYFSTRKILVDDDSALSESILLNLMKEKIQAFSLPSQAISFFNSEYKALFKKDNLFSEEHYPEEYEINTLHPAEINLKNLKCVSLENKYTQDISVLIIDYHMPEMNGLELLEKIQCPEIRKLLITSETDYKIAVDAFNKGIIHAYIRKDEPDFNDRLRNVIQDLEWEYFINLTTPITEAATQGMGYFISIELFTYFNNLVNRKNIVAFCLLTKIGTFLLIDRNKKRSYFIIKTNEQIKELTQLAKEDGASKETIELLAQGKVIPFLGEDKEAWEIPAKDWEKHLYPTTSINEDMFCCLITESDLT